MVDVLAGRVIDEPVVVITNGRIASVVGRGGARPLIPAGAARIDLPGKTILPGLIDMHVHLAGTPLIGGRRRLDYTDSFWATLGVPNAKSMLDAGFTTVRNLGSGEYADVALKQGIDGGFFPGPRIVPAAYSFGATGGHCGGGNGLPPSLSKAVERGVNGPDAVRTQVRENRKFGAEVIKVCATGGVFSRNTDPGAQQMSEAELRAAAEEAHMLGMKVARMRMARRGSRLRFGRGSTRSSMPAWSTMKGSGSPGRRAPSSRWTSSTPNIPSPKARRTASTRRTSRRTAMSPTSSATISGKRTRRA
jgi:imidazolonepropionase-like amidohydrolase